MQPGMGPLTMMFDSAAKVLAERMPKYYGTSWCRHAAFCTKLVPCLLHTVQEVLQGPCRLKQLEQLSKQRLPRKLWMFWQLPLQESEWLLSGPHVAGEILSCRNGRQSITGFLGNILLKCCHASTIWHNIFKHSAGNKQHASAWDTNTFIGALTGIPDDCYIGHICLRPALMSWLLQSPFQSCRTFGSKSSSSQTGWRVVP